jgi:DNA-binding transcriptional LysR family regulator
MICPQTISIADVDPHLLRTFVAVADTRSFSSAARRLQFTQSAVSQHIASLEADLGTALLTRRPVALTPAGERLLRHARLLLVRLEAARADVTRSLTPPGRLALGLTPLAWAPTVAAALSRLRSVSVRLETRVRVTDRASVAEAVAVGALDAGLVDGFAVLSDPLRLPDFGSLTAVGVAESPAVVAVAEGHPLARRRGLALADLADAYWVDAPGVASPGDLPLDGLRFGLHYDGADVAVLAGLIAAGHGIAVLPSRVTDEHPGLAGVPITAPRLIHRVELLRPADQADDPAQHLADLLGAIPAASVR